MTSAIHVAGSTNRIQGIRSILDGKFNICLGLEDLCRALKDLRCGKEYEAQKNIVNGIHQIKVGVREVENGLHDLRGEIDPCAFKLIRDGICCDIQKGLEIMCGVLKDICCGEIREAEKCLVKGIGLIKEGLCKIEKGLDDIFL